MSISSFSLEHLGWRAACSQQLTIADLDYAYPARVAAVHRGRLNVLSERGERSVIVGQGLLDELHRPITVGDWVLVEAEADRVHRALDAYSCITRQAAGREHRSQAICANVDTLFVVTSCNDDCNPSRLERYLSLAFEAQVTAVVVLTKTDLCDDPAVYIEQARVIGSRANIVALDATSLDDCERLSPWLERGQSVAFVGSSGVGKSTLINTLSGRDTQATSSIREDDSKGRHTTTSRQLLPLPSGAWVIDTPGMRELAIGAIETGLSEVFPELASLARSCRFRDCTHENDDGCALRAAVAAGQFDERRLRNYLKLQREAAHANRTLRERRERERRLGRLYRDAAVSRKRRGPDGGA